MINALTLALFLTAGPTDAEADLNDAVKHLRAFREVKALESLRRARLNAAGEPKLLARVHLVTGLAQAQLAREREALEAFEAAVKLDPEIAPSQEDTSPKVLEWFNRVRAANGLEPLGAKKEVAPVEVKSAPVAVVVPPPSEPPPPVEQRSRVPFYLGVGVLAAGGVVATTGLLFGSRAKSLEEQARSEPRATAAMAAHRSATQNAGTANALYIAAGILGLAGGVVVGTTF